jgi:hypothetical protein
MTSLDRVIKPDSSDYAPSQLGNAEKPGFVQGGVGREIGRGFGTGKKRWAEPPQPALSRQCTSVLVFASRDNRNRFSEQK